MTTRPVAQGFFKLHRAPSFNFRWRPRENKGGKLRPTPAMMANIVPAVWSFDNLYDAVMA